MGNIVDDIVEEINIKPSKTKIILKWIINISIALIGIAFIFGEFKASFYNKMFIFEKSFDENAKSIELLENRVNLGFDSVDRKINKIFDLNLLIFNDFQTYNNEQLELIIDYGNSNKDLLKKMLNNNSLEKKRDIETQFNINKINNIKK